MSEIKVNCLVAKDALNFVHQGHSIGTDGCSPGVGVIIRMADASLWCAHLTCSLQGHSNEFAAIHDATFSTLANTLNGVPISVDACTLSSLDHSAGAIWAGVQQYFDGAKQPHRSKAAHINTNAHGLYANAQGAISYVGASQNLAGHPAAYNDHAIVPPPLKGFDTDTPLTQAFLSKIASQNYAFCLRYLSRTESEASGDLSPKEAQLILSNGLALMPVQHAPSFHKPELGWRPTHDLGARYGASAAANARTVGVPPGVSVWMDLEAVQPGTAPQDVIDYCKAWYDAVAAQGYLPGIYVGYDCGLSGQQLYELPFQAYWKSMSRVPDIPHRGYQMKQSPTTREQGIEVDINHMTTDAKGGRPQCWTLHPADQSPPSSDEPRMI